MKNLISKVGTQITMQGSLLKFTIICCVLVFCLSPVTGSNQVFQGEVLGHLGGTGIAGLQPPNYTGTLPHDDVCGYHKVIFRLSYSGETPVEITHLDVTQEITALGQTWNYTHASVELSSSLTLVSGASATFQVTGSSDFVEGVLFHVKITTTNLGICWISFSSAGITQSLPGWPLSTSSSTPINATNFSPGWFFLLPLSCALIMLLRQRDRNK